MAILDDGGSGWSKVNLSVPEIPVKLFKFTCLGQFHHRIGSLLNTSHWSNKPCSFANLGQIAKIHDVWTPGEIGGDIHSLVSLAPGILDNHLDQSCNEDSFKIFGEGYVKNLL